MLQSDRLAPTRWLLAFAQKKRQFEVHGFSTAYLWIIEISFVEADPWQGSCDGSVLMEETAAFDPSRRYVRILQARADGMVEFEFAVGEPHLFVEMIMPRAQFEEFCTVSQSVKSGIPFTVTVKGPDGAVLK